MPDPVEVARWERVRWRNRTYLGARLQTMEPDELADFERRMFAVSDRTSLGDLRRAIERRRREFAG